MVFENVFRVCPKRAIFAERVREHFRQVLLDGETAALGVLRDRLRTWEHLKTRRTAKLDLERRDVVHLRVLLSAMSFHLIGFVAREWAEKAVIRVRVELVRLTMDVRSEFAKRCRFVSTDMASEAAF